MRRDTKPKRASRTARRAGNGSSRAKVVRDKPRTSGAPAATGLARRLDEALEQQAATSEILRVISSSPGDPQPVFDMIAERAMRLCGALHGAVITFDGTLVHLAAHVDVSPEFAETLRRTFPRPPSRATSSTRAILTRAIVHIPDIANDPEFELAGPARSAGFRSALAVPMLRNGRAMGAVVVFGGQPVPFSDGQVGILQTFADQALIAIENGRLFKDLESRNRDLTESLEQQTATSEILRVISRSPTNVQPVFDALADSAARLCEGMAGVLLPFDGELMHVGAVQGPGRDQVLRAWADFFPYRPGPEVAVGQAVLERRVIHYPDVLAQPPNPFRDATRQAGGYRAFLAVPLLRDGNVVGVIACWRAEARAFSDRQILLMQTFADQAVIAIENVRLFRALEARNTDLTEALEQKTATGEILRAISSSPTDVQPVFDAIVESAGRLCEAEFSAVARFEDGLLHLAAISNMSPEETAAYHSLFPRAPGRHFIIGRAFVDGRPVHVEDVHADPDYEPRTLEVLQRAAPYRSYLGIPIVKNGVPIGAIGCGRHVVKPFTQAQIDLVKTFADQAVIAIENVRLFTELGARNRELTETLEQQTATGEILRVISSSPTDVQPVFDTIVASAVRLCGATRGHIFRFDGEFLRFAAAHGARLGFTDFLEQHPVPLGSGSVSGRAGLERRTVHVPDVLNEPDYQQGELLKQQGYRAVLAVPLLRDGTLLGVIAILKSHPEPFTDKQIDLVTTFADQAVIAIENVRLFTELGARNTELRVALEHQTATSELLKVIGRSTFDLQPVFDTLAENVVRLCEAERSFVFRFDGQLLRGVAAHNAPPEIVAFVEQNPVAPGRGSATARAALERRTIHVHDAQADPEYTYGSRQVEPFRTILTVPMLRAGELLGVLLTYRLEVRPFTDSQVALIETFADQAAIAIENARLLSQLQAKNADLTETLEQQTATGEILRVISSSPTNVQPVLDTIVQSAVRLCDGLFGAVNMFDGEMILAPAAAFNLTPDVLATFERIFPARPSHQHLTGRAMLSRTLAHLPDVRNDPDYAPEIARAGGWRAAIAAPMLREGQPIGSIFVARAQAGPFSDRQIELLKTFADQAVIAIENVRLFTELEARNRDLTETLEQQTATGEILRAISGSPTDVQPVFDAIVESAVRLCGADLSGLYRFDGKLIHFAAHHGRTLEEIDAARQAFPRPPGRDSVTGRAILAAASVQVVDASIDPDMAEPLRESFRTILSVPMIRDGRPVGAITVGRRVSGAFSDRQIDLLKTFADQAVIAIENVRLFKELEVRNRDLTETLEQQTATGEILRVISSSPTDVQPVFDTIAQSAARFCNAERSVVLRYDGELLHFVAHHGLPAEGVDVARRVFPMAADRRSAGGRAVLSAAVVHIPDIQADPDYRLGPLAEASTFRSIVGVPMLRDGTPIGAIMVHRAPPGPFPDQQIALLKTFADQAVIAIENVRLFKELEARNRDLTETLEQQTATGEILRVISSSPTDVQPVFETIGASARRLCGADISLVARFDGEILQLTTLHGVAEDGRESVRAAFPMRADAETVTARTFRTQAVVHVADVLDDRSYETKDAARSGRFRGALGVPMVREGQVIGVIFVARSEPGLFADTQVALLETFADQAVIAIENVRLFKELEAKNRDLTETLEQRTATGEILRVISGSPTDVQPVFETIAASATRLCAGRFCFVLRFEDDLMHFGASYGLTVEGLEAFKRALPRPADEATAGGRSIVHRSVAHIPDVVADPSYGELGVAEAVTYRSLLAVPMLRDGQPIGSIAVGRPEAGFFPDGQVALLQTFADQAVIAVENVRLFKELEVKNRDLTETLDQQTATGEILRVISSSPTDVQPVFDAIAASARRLCDGAHGSVQTYDGSLIHLVAMDQFDVESADSLRRLFPLRPGRGSAATRAIASREVVQVPDVLDDPEYVLAPAAQSSGYRSVIGVPMLREGNPIGSITVTRPATGMFPDNQVHLLKTFADQAVIAIENVRLFKELEVRNRDLTETLEQQTATGEILRVISSSPTDVQPVFDTIVASAVRLCGARMGAVYRFESGLVDLVAHHNYSPEVLDVLRQMHPRPPQSDQASGRAILTRAVAQIEDTLSDPHYPREVAVVPGGFRSILAVPMLREGAPIGAIVITRGEAGPFASGHIELVKTFADQAVIAIENVRLFQELQARTGELTRSVSELQALGEVSQAVSSTLDLETVLATIVSRAVQLSDSHAGIVYEFDEATQTFQSRATHQLSSEYLDVLRAAPVRLGEGTVGRAGVSRQPVQVADIETEGHLVAPQVREIQAREGLRSLLAVPLVREDRLLGGLVILRRERGAFSAEVVAMLQTFATQSVLAMHNAGLFREIQRQKQHSEALVETSPVAITTLDLEGRVVGWNPGAERLFGYTQAEAMGRPLEDLLARPEIREEIRAGLRQTRHGERIRAITRRARKDGSLVDVEISATPVMVDGREVGVIGIYHDISELLQARREAEAANEAKSAFLATMSHEIRTPMNAVIGMSGLLLNTPLNDEQREYAEVVRQSGDALLTVINDILDFSKIEAGRLELESQPFDLRECVEGALDLVATRAAEKGIDLAYLIADGTPAGVVGDVTRLRQILLNLLSNAVKFTERGEVVLTVNAARTGPASEPYDLTFSVRDTGIGIPADRLGRLFQSFSQVDASTTRRYGGTGLGLAISQRLTEMMGGRITVTSEVGAGSDFRFTIRAAAAEAPVVTRRDLSGPQPSLQGKRVLVVDDNATNRRILTAHLDNWGLPARATESPREALGWIQSGERFDVGILDMHMPEMDGVALARAIRDTAAGSELPLVLFTSLGRREARADEEGFAAYLHKPIKPSQLFDTLISVLADRPVHVSQPRVVTRSELDPDMAGGHPLRILLAEDNVVNQKVALRLLGQMGYRADVAGNGLEAIDAVARQTYDVVLMDVQMPEMDGFEASREINRRWTGVQRPRIVAMTANAMQGDRELCEAAGMDDYVSKPIRVEELVAALERCGGRSEREEALPGRAGEQPPAAEGVVDRLTVERLVETMGAPFVAELIGTFLADGRDLVAALHQGLAGKDLDGFRRAAHSLKSNAETLGATGLAARARELETVARGGSLDGVAERLGPLTDEYERAAGALEGIRNGLRS